MIKGRLYIFSSPSGAGKSSLIQALLKLNTRPLRNAQLSVSYTTRTPRKDEIHGKHYFFINHNKFEKMISRNQFLEYAEVFDHYYGTSRKIIEQALINGTNVFLDINWKGAQQVRAKIPQTCSIFILPPSKEELNRRLCIRGQDDKEIIAKRLKQATIEISHYTEYDYLIINDDFNTALNNLETIIRAEYFSLNRQNQTYDAFITKLLAD